MGVDGDARARVLRLIAAEVGSLRPDTTIRTAVDGVDGAGKTRFADELADALRPFGREVIRVTADDFLNPRNIRLLVRPRLSHGLL